ncbi:MAG: primosomal protein N' [Firmicutes bacterium]|nr:primosomal protein N' [Bacillota bacterium]
MAKLAAVLVDLITSATNKTFTYSIPNTMKDQAVYGCKVQIPFGPRTLTGYIVPEKPEPREEVRPISAILTNSLFTREAWELARFVADKYLCHLVEALYLVLPPGINRGLSVDRRVRYVDLLLAEQEAQNLASQLANRAPAQVRILFTLLQQRPLTRQHLLKQAPAAASSLQALIDRGAVTTWIETEPLLMESKPVETIKEQPPLLTEDQSRALQPVLKALSSYRHERFLLHGVTGSGKTEVYLQVLAAALRQGRGGIVLVPEIALTPQMRERFVRRFGSKVAVLHSGLRDRERYNEWLRIEQGQARIVLGARSAIYAPLKSIGVIVLDEEHETAYKQEESPRYHAREVALWRASKQGAVVILGSATPAVDTYYRAQKGDYRLLTLPRRIAHRPLPQVKIVDMRAELLAGNRSIFSRLLQVELKKTLVAGRQAILFLNRRGYSTFVLCRRCGLVAKCPHCDLALTLHKVGRRLICHYCGYNEPQYHTCPDCGSNHHIRDFGCGTQRVVAEANRLWPQARILRLDADTSARVGATDKIITSFSRGEADILVGTQMVTKGLDIARVTLVGIISADLTLNLPDPYAAERTFQLLEQVAGRTGRGEVPGQAVLQTYTPDHFSIKAAKQHNYQAFYQQELERRRRYLYPPFTRIILVRALAAAEKTAASILNQLLALLPTEEATRIEGPAPCPFLKVGDKFRWQLIIKGANLKKIKNQLAAALPQVAAASQRVGARVTVDIDPLFYL